MLAKNDIKVAAKKVDLERENEKLRAELESLKIDYSNIAESANDMARILQGVTNEAN